MTDHNLFYYPYASLTDAQIPLLKVAALYFDKLVILVPTGASWNFIGADPVARDAVQQLRDAGMLELVTPSTVLAKYEGVITRAIRADVADPEFVKLCETQEQATGQDRWTLSMAKVPQELQADASMRHLLGHFVREVAQEAGQNPAQSSGNPGRYYQYAESGQVYDELRGDYPGVEFRYMDLPLALGEAIMMNHALFAGLLHADATPITDDPFHNQAFSLKLGRALQDPVVQQIRADHIKSRKLRTDALAFSTLTDPLLNLPVLNAQLPLAEVLEFRLKNEDALAQARDRLGRLAYAIKAEPWTPEFADELEEKTLPAIQQELDNVRKARKDWVKQRGKLALSGTGIAIGVATAVLSVLTAPVAPVALAVAGLGLLSSSGIPAAQVLLDWRDGKQTLQENGLHYLLSIQ